MKSRLLKWPFYKHVELHIYILGVEFKIMLAGLLLVQSLTSSYT